MDSHQRKQKSYVYLIVVALASGVYLMNGYMQGVREREKAGRAAAPGSRRPRPKKHL